MNKVVRFRATKTITQLFEIPVKHYSPSAKELSIEEFKKYVEEVESENAIDEGIFTVMAEITVKIEDIEVVQVDY